ncbi:MAG: ATP-dependent DNA helicase [Bacteroidetes bacterium GWE2_41_25]|nr:MAG: ATP-dependent DNA helicase [Bacteroidetes bacterium GWA2_40_15]OFX97234.1 MAG: ATP-dependent DNA helicase [Bacteroidetes bacterium GWC2_40_22]OFY08975.1 MAG: ATP-dependent DNA helicase [Bacteroidetes bacterium GWE2_41_25]OFY57941.1 MAG: ATP-dependent DNA helicase [Bacteroidetes bacterium GWF2_41_9]HAM11252.1 ATP-dependent DNA helicase [Bacteroidales bacterium]
MATNYLNDLNDSQRQAVLHTEGPALVIAGAGAGKTRVLTYRIAHLLNNKVPAGKILSLTFTNKAAREMKERISRIVSPEIARYLWMGTFHSIFAKILRMEGDKLGYRSNFTIYDSSDSKSLIRSIIKELNLDDNIYKPGVIASRISSAKNNLITASMYAADSSLHEYDKASRMPLLADVYKTYAARCFKANSMDFDDLLLNTNILFRDFPATLAEYQERFGYILVDEYQDTNYSQYLIVKKLAASHHNLCVVGDDAQSIYSFRGARIENILEFKNDYSDYQLYKLEQNYRSTQTIVNAANTIIANNEGQIKKNVFSMNEPGEKIQVFQAMTDSEEGFNIASDIFDKRFSLRLNWSDFAVLYRTNAQSRIFEETLRRKNIPYRIYGGLSFYDRKEIKDVLAYFRMVINPEDEEALKRSINYPKRGIGDTTIEKIFELSSSLNTSAWSVLSEAGKYSDHFNAGTVKKLLLYRDVINNFSINSDTTDAFTKAREIALGSGIMKELKDGKSPEEVSRYENMEELLNAIKVFTEAADTNGEPNILEAYMANVALLTDQDTDNKEDRNKVTLMTMHSAKGLEFKHVYIAGMEDTLFPSPMSSGSAKELEEERRLFYVAVTRAEKQATLSYALNRYKWGNLERCSPSRFLKEIDQKFLHYPQTGGKPFNAPGNSHAKPTPLSEEPLKYVKDDRFKKLSKAVAGSSSAFTGTDASLFAEGDMVQHERFGKGVIISIEGEPPNTTASVKFDTDGTRKLLLRFAKLKKL